MKDKKKYKIVITGASSGIGYALAEKLAQEGHELILLARREEKLKSLAENNSYKIITKKVDVTDFKLIEAALENLDIDILINNAGIALGVSKFFDTKFDHINQMIDTNIKGVTNLCRFILPKMIKKNSGYIINIGSVLGTYPFPYAHVYGATKSFVEQLSLNLRADLIGTKVKVTLISPGTVQTDFHAVRCGNNKELAEAAFKGITPLIADEIADVIQYCIQTPEHVNINRIEVSSIDQNLWAILG